METKSYNWLLYQFSQRKINLNILEVGISKRDKLIDWFRMDSNNNIVRNTITPPNNLTKYLVSYFLSKRSPILDEYNPDKYICYLYHKTGRKIITAKEASEMANNQLHGLQVESIHMIPPDIKTNNIYTIESSNRNNELHTEIYFHKFTNNLKIPFKDQEIADKIMNFVLNLCECLSRFSKPIQSIKLDLFYATNGQIFLIKANEIIFSDETGKDFKKLPNLGIQEDEYSEDPLNHSRKEPHKFKIPLSKPLQHNSSEFLEMIAKTIQKIRKKKMISDYFAQKTKETSFKRNISKINSSRYNKDNIAENNLSTMNDLLKYLEKTRPKDWIRDVSKKNNYLAAVSTKKLYQSRRVSLQYIQETPLEVLRTAESKAVYYRKSKIIYNLKEISPIKLSYRSSSTTLIPTKKITQV